MEGLLKHVHSEIQDSFLKSITQICLVQLVHADRSPCSFAIQAHSELVNARSHLQKKMLLSVPGIGNDENREKRRI